MMLLDDKRFQNDNIFKRRSQEWNFDKITSDIIELFKNIEMIDGWKFINAEWDINENSRKKEEISRHVYKTLCVKLLELNKKGDEKKEHIYKFQVPILIMDQFFYIGGLLKIPIFQIFDDPIVFRKSNKGVFLKFKSNVMSMLCSFIRKNVYCNLFINTIKTSKNIPFELLIVNTHTKEEFLNFINKFEKTNSIIDKIKSNCLSLWESNTETELIEKLGKYRLSMNNVDLIKKGKSIIFAIKNCLKIDKYTAQFIESNDIIFDIIKTLNGNLKLDTNLSNKRIRFSEYILGELVKCFFDMLCVLSYNKSNKFKIPQTILVDSCNVNSIVHHNFPNNPISEISSLIQGTLIGPGSFKKENVPDHLKNIDNSQYKIICPADTPDRDGCGVILNFVPGINLENNGKFSKTLSQNICSYPITFVPFLQNDDQTRLQMASSQLKQAILLDNAEKPFIKTGIENKYLEYSTFKKIAKNDGEVLFSDKDILIVIYNNEKTEAFKIGYRTLSQNGVDYLYTKLKEGDFFLKGDILYESKFLQDGEITLGQNLLTAIGIWKGYNYEDGIVIRKSVAKLFTSLHVLDISFIIEPGQILLSLNDDNYTPIPSIGDKISRGGIIAKLKNMHKDGYENLNIDAKEIISPVDGVITNLEIFPNVRNKQVPEFNHFIETCINNQTNRIKNLKLKLKDFMSSSEINEFLDSNDLSKLEINEKREKNYKSKGNTIDGVLIKLQIIYKEELNVGDKIANRHGHKGVVSKIIEDEYMPKLEDGRVIDIILNPLGIISRMNIGQLYEMHLNEALYRFKKHLTSNIDIPKQKMFDQVYEFSNLYDNTENKWVSNNTLLKFKKEYKKNPQIAINSIQIIQPPFKSLKPKQLFDIMEYTNSKFKMKVFDIETNKFIKNPLSFGYIYFLKLMHRASSKFKARSIGVYNKNTLQPLGGSGKKNITTGHRFGEMEQWALASHGASTIIKELLTTYSDSPAKKNKMLSDILGNPELIVSTNASETPRSLQLLDSYLKILGINLEK